MRLSLEDLYSSAQNANLAADIVIYSGHISNLTALNGQFNNSEARGIIRKMHETAVEIFSLLSQGLGRSEDINMAKLIFARSIRALMIANHDPDYIESIQCSMFKNDLESYIRLLKSVPHIQELN